MLVIYQQNTTINISFFWVKTREFENIRYSVFKICYIYHTMFISRANHI